MESRQEISRITTSSSTSSVTACSSNISYSSTEREKDSDNPTPEDKNNVYYIEPTDFTSIKKVGDGSYGKIYLGLLISNCNENVEKQEKTVAIKKIKLKKQKRLDCDKEKNIMQQLTEAGCKNIVTFYRYNVTQVTYSIVMEYLPFGDLRDYLLKNAELTLAQRLHIMKSLTEGVYQMHELNIVHRDIKLENALIASIGPKIGVKLCDFGFAKKVDDKVELGGTPPYCAPEIFDDHPHTLKSDIYSLGFTYWEIINGKKAFSDDKLNESEERKEMLLKTFHGVHEAIPDKWPNKLKTLIDQCWAREPKLRPEAKKVLSNINKFFKKIEKKESLMKQKDEEVKTKGCCLTT